MKVKKQKRHRRAVRFYTACFGFREPFKVLCDGTFVHHLLVNKIVPADTAIANILGAQVKLFTTRCVLEELKGLGKDYTDSLNAAHNLLTARCDHEQRKSAVCCLTDVIGETNNEHFYVASQDDELRREFQEIPGVPLIYALRNSLFLEKPSTMQRQFAKEFEEGRSHMTEMEYRLLKMKKAATAEGASISSDVNASGNNRVNSRTKRTGLEVKDTVQFKKKRVKGPNPLSCLPKKKMHQKQDDASEKGNSSADKTSGTKSKKRKRSRKKKTVTESMS